ncbi:hypothetical protein HPB48_008731 [Haemaphysalis longicornis]|uniref:Uncharacterized protein n=1 Tax=Haemaphysalis longicornis TaxID=44386 RepID=A0A9J6G5V5_HAELO|nr:hypothetical protein HPB48_008731 [Haemaphysalis longicornis]
MLGSTHIYLLCVFLLHQQTLTTNFVRPCSFRAYTKLAWVPKGADLNIFENVWGRMKVALNRTPISSATEDELWTAVLADWQRLASDTSLVTLLYESLPSRMSAVVEVNGGRTHY